MDSRTAYAVSCGSKITRNFFPDLPEADNIYAATLYHADLRIGQLLDALDEMKISRIIRWSCLARITDRQGVQPILPIALSYDSATGPGYGIGAAKGITGGAPSFQGGIDGGRNRGALYCPLARQDCLRGRWIRASVICSAVDLYCPTFCELGRMRNCQGSYKPDGMSQVS